jgi:prephenate dehydrogenase
VSEKTEKKYFSTDKKIGIIGGEGAMGKLFARFFTRRGFRVMVSDLGTKLDNKELAGQADIIVFSVPLHKTTEIISETIPYIRKDRLLLDLSSLKVNPVGEMLKSSAGVIGLHPMFGPQVSSFRGQKIILCPARADESVIGELENLFAAEGARTKRTTPEEHDKMMAVIQVLMHFSTIIMGRTLRELNIDIEESLEYTSPIYRLEMNFISRLFAQDASLYGAMAMQNPHSEKVLAGLSESFEKYREFIKEKNLSDYIDDFGKTSEFFGDFSADAMKTGNKILDFLISENK